MGEQKKKEMKLLNIYHENQRQNERDMMDVNRRKKVLEEREEDILDFKRSLMLYVEEGTLRKTEERSGADFEIMKEGLAKDFYAKELEFSDQYEEIEKEKQCLHRQAEDLTEEYIQQKKKLEEEGEE